MATNNKRTVKEEPKIDTFGSEIAEKSETIQNKTTNGSKAQESTYTAKELAAAHKTFNASYEIVATALKLAGKERATSKETKELVTKFMNTEVK